MPNIKGPDGKVISFPEGTSDADIAAAFAGNSASTPSENPLLSLIKGAGEGVVHTLSAADDFAAKHLPAFMTTPIGQKPSAENSARAVQYAKDLATPANTMQSVGRTAEQIGEFFLPSGAEKGAASLLANAAPGVAKLALPAARVAGGAIVNKAQGGSLLAGAAAGVGGEAIGAGLKAIAPSVANIALRPGRLGRAFGKDAGAAMLADTAGIRPETINASANNRIAALSAGNDKLAAALNTPVTTQPGIDVVDDAINRLEKQNSKGPSIEQLKQVRANLTEPPSNPAQVLLSGASPAGQDGFAVNLKSGLLDTDQPALTAQNLKRGLRTDYVANFDPTHMKGTREVAHQAAGAIDGSLDAALGPEYANTNSRMASLYSVQDATQRRMLDPTLFEKYGAKAGAHTGALAGTLFGAHEGERYGGTTGAVLGGLAGFAAPELLLSPEAQAVAARAAYSPKTRSVLLPALKAAGLQLNRSPEGR